VDRILSKVINWEDLEGSCWDVSRVTIRRAACEVLLTLRCFGWTANFSHPPDNSHKHSSTKHTIDRNLNNICIKTAGAQRCYVRPSYVKWLKLFHTFGFSIGIMNVVFTSLAFCTSRPFHPWFYYHNNEESVILWYYAVPTSKYLPTFRNIIVPPSAGWIWGWRNHTRSKTFVTI
jgi:hypothetical protein